MLKIIKNEVRLSNWKNPTLRWFSSFNHPSKKINKKNPSAPRKLSTQVLPPSSSRVPLCGAFSPRSKTANFRKTEQKKSWKNPLQSPEILLKKKRKKSLARNIVRHFLFRHFLFRSSCISTDWRRGGGGGGKWKRLQANFNSWQLPKSHLLLLNKNRNNYICRYICASRNNRKLLRFLKSQSSWQPINVPSKKTILLAKRFCKVGLYLCILIQTVFRRIL